MRKVSLVGCVPVSAPEARSAEGDGAASAAPSAASRRLYQDRHTLYGHWSIFGHFRVTFGAYIALGLASFQGRGHIETCDDIDLRRIWGEEHFQFDEEQCGNALFAGK